MVLEQHATALVQIIVVVLAAAAAAAIILVHKYAYTSLLSRCHWLTTYLDFRFHVRTFVRMQEPLMVMEAQWSGLGEGKGRGVVST